MNKFKKIIKNTIPMNYYNCSSKNFLLAGEGDYNLEDVLEFVVSQAENGHTSLILTCHSKINITLDQFDGKSHLNRIIIMYFENIDKMITKILNLHEWTIHPNIVIVDLNSLFKKLGNKSIATELMHQPTKKDICFLVSSLLNYIQLLSKKNSFTTFSITVADKNKLPKNYCQILIDLYFYNSKFSNFLNLKDNLPIV